MLDAGMVILSALGIGLARAGKPSRSVRVLIMICAGASAGMNLAAADPGSWRSVAAYVVGPGVPGGHHRPGDRRHPPARPPAGHRIRLGAARPRRGGRAAAGGRRGLVPAAAVLAPSGTLRGLRQMVLDAAPVPGTTTGVAASRSPAPTMITRSRSTGLGGRARTWAPSSRWPGREPGRRSARDRVLRPRRPRSCPATGVTPSTGTGQLPGGSRPSSHRSRACRRAPGAPTSPKSYAGSPTLALTCGSGSRRTMTSPPAEPPAQALGESLAALAVQVAALRGQIAQINQRLDRAGLRGDLDLAARFEELARDRRRRPGRRRTARPRRPVLDRPGPPGIYSAAGRAAAMGRYPGTRQSRELRA